MFISTDNNSQLRFRSAFTLIELLVVIVIIGILATLTTISLTSARGKARDARRISDLKQIATALELYQADNNSYPAFITGGNALVNPSDATKVYMKKVPSDPSTNASYSYYGSSSRFTLRTTIEKSVDNIPVGPIIITSGGGVKQALNTDNSYMNPDLTFGALVGHWMLDGANTSGNTVYDLSGYDNNGTNSNAVLTNGKYGESDGSYRFNFSSSSAINCGNAANITGSQISYGSWVKGISTDNSHYPVFGRLGPSSIFTSPQYGLAWVGNRFVVLLPANSFNFMQATASANVWYHVFVTFNKPDVKIYINGVNVVNGTFNADIVSVANNFYIGRSPGGKYASIEVSDVRVYNKALDAGEISALYNATKP